MSGKTILFLALITYTHGCSPKPYPQNLHVAALHGNTEAVQHYIKTGEDINERDAYGSSPLIVAVTFDRTNAAELLIEAGADLNIRNNDGATALHIAAFFCRKELVKTLLESGADRDVRNNFGSTPLESVTVPFEDVRALYDSLGLAFGPMGLELDYEQIHGIRPVIAKMLQP